MTATVRRGYPWHQALGARPTYEQVVASLGGPHPPLKVPPRKATQIWNSPWIQQLRDSLETPAAFSEERADHAQVVERVERAAAATHVAAPEAREVARPPAPVPDEAMRAQEAAAQQRAMEAQRLHLEAAAQQMIVARQHMDAIQNGVARLEQAHAQTGGLIRDLTNARLQVRPEVRHIIEQPITVVNQDNRQFQEHRHTHHHAHHQGPQVYVDARQAAYVDQRQAAYVDQRQATQVAQVAQVAHVHVHPASALPDAPPHQGVQAFNLRQAVLEYLRRHGYDPAFLASEAGRRTQQALEAMLGRRRGALPAPPNLPRPALRDRSRSPPRRRPAIEDAPRAIVPFRPFAPSPAAGPAAVNPPTARALPGPVAPHGGGYVPGQASGSGGVVGIPVGGALAVPNPRRRGREEAGEPTRRVRAKTPYGPLARPLPPPPQEARALPALPAPAHARVRLRTKTTPPAGAYGPAPAPVPPPALPAPPVRRRLRTKTRPSEASRQNGGAW